VGGVFFGGGRMNLSANGRVPPALAVSLPGGETVF